MKRRDALCRGVAVAGAVTLASLVAPGFATAASVNAIDASHAPRSALSKWVRVPVTYACTADSAITQVTVSVNGQTQRRLSDQTQRGRNSSNPKKWMPVRVLERPAPSAIPRRIRRPLPFPLQAPSPESSVAALIRSVSPRLSAKPTGIRSRIIRRYGHCPGLDPCGSL